MKSVIRILAVDGGGIGGIIPARLLDRLNSADPRVIENADLVAGTSTGGLIALGLAAGHSPGELCRLYQEHAKDIFSDGNRRVRLLWPFRAKYGPGGLRKAVEAIVGTKSLGELTAKPVLIPITALKRPDGRHRPAGIFLSTAFRLTRNQNPKLEKYGSSQWKCVDVALATAAAPTYFPAHEAHVPRGSTAAKWLCWDGGIIANNPAMAAYGEILRLDLEDQDLELRRDPSETPDIRILSLGTGYRDIDISAGDWGLLQAARPVVQALMDGSVGSTAFLLRQILGRRVVRVSPELPSDYEMDDPTKVDDLNSLAGDFYQNQIGRIPQPHGPPEDLTDWLETYWYPPMN